MVKVIFLTITLVLLVSSIGLCAAENQNTGLGEMQAGVRYYGFNPINNQTSRSGVAGHEIYGNIGTGYGFFANHLQADGITYTDLGFSTSSWIPHVSLQVGQRRTISGSAENRNDAFYGVKFSRSFSRKLSAEITYQKGNNFTTETFGISYDVAKLIQIDLVWKNINENNQVTLKGIGGGLQISF